MARRLLPVTLLSYIKAFTPQEECDSAPWLPRAFYDPLDQTFITDFGSSHIDFGAYFCGYTINAGHISGITSTDPRLAGLTKVPFYMYMFESSTPQVLMNLDSSSELIFDEFYSCKF